MWLKTLFNLGSALLTPTAVVFSIVLSILHLKDRKVSLHYQVISDKNGFKKRGNEPKILFWNKGKTSISILQYVIKWGEEKYSVTATKLTSKEGQEIKDFIHVPIVIKPGEGYGLYFNLTSARNQNSGSHLGNDIPLNVNKPISLSELPENIFLTIYTTHKQDGIKINIKNHRILKI